MSVSRTDFLAVLAFILGGLVIASLSAWLPRSSNLGKPTNAGTAVSRDTQHLTLSDRKLISLFRYRRVAFEKLRDMAIEDNQSYLGGTPAERGTLSEKRWQRYDALLHQIYPGLIMTTDWKKNVRFIFISCGVSAIAPGWLKGIEYMPGDHTAEGLLVENLDEGSKLAPNVYLRTIEPHWFIVYQRTDD
jgi:hypothetical protein